VVETISVRDALDRYATKFAARPGTKDLVFLITRHCAPLLGSAIAAVTKRQVQTILDPLQQTTPKTAKRTLCALSTLMGYAVAIDLRPDNPCDPRLWKFIWPPVPKAEHYRSMPHSDVPALVQRLLAKDSVTSLCLAFLILNAMRSSEAIGLEWSEVDPTKRLIVIDEARMKARREHRIPMSDQALAILGAMRQRFPNSDYVFPAPHGGKPSSRALEAVLHKQMNENCSVHGFRSSFSTWAHESTDHSHEIIEQALAHQEGGATRWRGRTIGATQSNVVGP
jgi:integrase